MSHTACSGCGAQVDAGAPACPACGRSLAARKQRSTWVIVLVVVGVLLLLALGAGTVMALGIYGARKYVKGAQAVEAQAALAQIGRAAERVYQEEQPDGSRRLCPSATTPVPATVPKARKYTSDPSEWLADEAANAGFACLGFSMLSPQYYQYSYEATEEGFVARARGDLDGDGVESVYELTGRVVDGRLEVSPTITETNPGE